MTRITALHDPNYSTAELAAMLAEVGANVRVHRTVQFFSPHKIHLGSHIRIDCFAVLSAGEKGIRIGRNVHLAAGVYLFGSGGRIDIAPFCGLSSRVAVYTASEDYSGNCLTNPTVPDRHRKVLHGDVTLKKHVLVGAGSVIMPGVTIGVGGSVGALSYVNKNVPDFAIVTGNPPRLIGRRGREILEREREFLAETQR